MAVYTIFGGVIKQLRYATENDILTLDDKCRKTGRLDKEAKMALENKSWIVAEREGGEAFLTNIAKLRADGGLSEILDALGEKESYES